MTTQTYCTVTDIENIIGRASIIVAIDDDMDGIVSAEDEAKIDACIEWGANEINKTVRHQYALSAVASNTWLKWANAELAAFRLRTRKNNPAESGNAENAQEIKRILNEIRWGREQLPDQLPRADHLPCVTNFTPQLGRGVMPVRVDEEESTTTRPAGNRQRYTSDQAGNGGFYWN